MRLYVIRICSVNTNYVVVLQHNLKDSAVINVIALPAYLYNSCSKLSDTAATNFSLSSRTNFEISTRLHATFT